MGRRQSPGAAHCHIRVITGGHAAAVVRTIAFAGLLMRAATACAATTAPAGDRQCLALAIAYEAGHESDAGQDAVGQVILNRLHHPAWPKTVCGVVFQGSDRSSGCQFSFTCDGALRRRLSPAVLARAAAAADRTLAGKSASTVGTATHYHAYYVTPRWAARLQSAGRIGAHLFYRLPGRIGDAPAFAGLAFDPRVAAVVSSLASTPVPPQPGVFSTWGLAVLKVRRDGNSVKVRAVAPPPRAQASGLLLE